MGSVFSKPKAPVIPAPKVMPEPDNAQVELDKRRKMAERVMRSGMAATQLSERGSKPLGQ